MRGFSSGHSGFPLYLHLFLIGLHAHTTRQNKLHLENTTQYKTRAHHLHHNLYKLALMAIAITNVISMVHKQKIQKQKQKTVSVVFRDQDWL